MKLIIFAHISLFLLYVSDYDLSITSLQCLQSEAKPVTQVYPHSLSLTMSSWLFTRTRSLTSARSPANHA